MKIVWERHYNGTAWGAWTARSAARFRGKPSATGDSPGIHFVATLESDSSVYHTWSPDCGTSWFAENIGGLGIATAVHPQTSPAVVSYDDGKLSVFMTSTNLMLWEAKKTESGWEPWVLIGGMLEDSSPAATRARDGSHRGIMLAAKIRERTPATSTTRGLWTRIWSANCQPASANGAEAGFCSDLCPCNEGQGDCDHEDTHTDCNGGLWCGKDFGPRFGLAATTDVCVRAVCVALPVNTPCVAGCPCGVGGACSSDDACIAGFACVNGKCKAL